MFKAYKEPPKPAFDMEKALIEKGLPLLGTAAGAAIGSAVAPGVGTTLGAQIGGSLGGMASGALSEEPGSQAQMMKGVEGAIKGYDKWREKVPSNKLDMGEDKEDESQYKLATVKYVDPTSNITNKNAMVDEAPMYSSSRAPRFARF